MTLTSTTLKRVMILLMMFSGLMSSYAQAAMVPTSSLIHSSDKSYSADDLQVALASESLQKQLVDLGVDPAELHDRVASLTPAEIQHLNAELKDAPAGGVLGVLLTIFIVFIVTDMLCATDIFTFVKCINK